MTITQMKYVITLANCLNFSEAAKLLYITQPSLSKQIVAIEEELGFKLFNRTNKTTELTAAGRIFCEGLKSILSDYTTLVEVTRQHARAESNCLRIGIMEFRSIHRDLLEILHILKNRGCQVDIISRSSEELLESLIHGKVDIIIQPSEPENPPIPETKQVFLYEVQNLLVVPADCPGLDNPSPKLADFADMDFILYAQHMRYFEENVRLSFKKAGVQPKIRIVETYSDLVVMVSSGMGICALPEEHYLATSPSLRFISVPEIVPSKMYALWKENAVNPVIPCFEELVLELRKKTI